jgi:hypothetical protein
MPSRQPGDFSKGQAYALCASCWEVFRTWTEFRRVGLRSDYRDLATRRICIEVLIGKRRKRQRSGRSVRVSTSHGRTPAQSLGVLCKRQGQPQGLSASNARTRRGERNGSPAVHVNVFVLRCTRTFDVSEHVKMAQLERAHMGPRERPRLKLELDSRGDED